MKFDTKRAYDAVRMSPERQQQIRSTLSSRYDQKEDIMMKSRSTKRLATVLIAAALSLLLFTITAFAYGDQIIQLLGGGRIEMGKTDDGKVYISLYSFEEKSVELRDGRVYFILDGNDTDITSYCTEATYYAYEKFADNDIRHVFIVGGAPDDLGWAEFIWNAEGDRLGSSTAYQEVLGEDGESEKPEWLKLAERTFRD